MLNFFIPLLLGLLIDLLFIYNLSTDENKQRYSIYNISHNGHSQFMFR